MKKQSVLKMTQTAVFMAIVTAMTFIPYVGYISLPGGLSITTLAVPVIIACILLGPASGTAVASTWGMTCLIYAVLGATADAVIFTNPLISVVPRVLVGIITSFAYIGLTKLIKNKTVPIIASSVIASLSNTVLVLTAIGLFGGAGVFRLGATLKLIIQVAVSMNGLIELALAVIIPLPIVLTLQKQMKKYKI